jgi:hypothetical protein
MLLNRTVTLCGTRLHSSAHVCAFFDSTEQQDEVLLPFFREGLANGEQILAIVPRDQMKSQEARLAAGGIDVRTMKDSDQLDLRSAEETYVDGGFFDADQMYGLVERALGGAGGAVRTCGDMSWALQDVPGSHALMEYEARVNHFVHRYDCTLVCIYDAARFNGRAIMDALSTHPYVIVGGILHTNPYYVSPDIYLQRLGMRASSVPHPPVLSAPHYSGQPS